MTSGEPPRDHAGMEVISKEECDRLLETTAVGRVAFLADGDLTVFPVNYRWHRGTVVFQSADGTKLEAAARHAPVAFEIDGWDEETATGWSVVVKGVAVEVDDTEVPELEALGLRPWAPPSASRRWVRIRPDEVTGRRIR